MKSLFVLLALLSLITGCQPSGTTSDAEVGTEALKGGERVTRRAPIVNAGTDISVEDSDGTGSERVQLSGELVSFRFPVETYSLYRNNVLIASGADKTIFQSIQLVPVGSIEFRMEAIDSRGNKGQDSVVVTVHPKPVASNSAPIVNAGLDQVKTDNDNNGSEAVTLAGSASDAQNNITAYRIYRNGAQIASGISVGVFSQTIVLPVGTHTIIMEATDAGGLRGSDTMTVVVKPAPNTAPVVNAGADITTTDSDGNGSEMITLAGSATDAQNNISSYRVLLNNVLVANSLRATISVPVGTHTVVMEATDAFGLKASDSVLIKVNPAPNTAPVVNAGVDVVLTDSDRSGSEMYTLMGSASDAQNNITSYKVLLNGIQVSSSLTASISVPVGTNTITMEASDAGGLKGSDSLVITVMTPNTPPVIVVPPPSGTNSPPVANAGPDINAVMPVTVNDRTVNGVAVKGNGGVSRTTVMGSASDPDNNIVEYVWKVNGVIVAKSNSATILTQNKLNFIQGVNTLELEVTDAGGLKGRDQAIVHYKPHIDSTGWWAAFNGTRASIPGVLQVGTGGMRFATDWDSNGSEAVQMTGSVNSIYPITSWKWELRGQVLMSGTTLTPAALTPTFTFPLGTNNINFVVTDSMGNKLYDVSDIHVSKPVVEQVPKIASNFDINQYLVTEWDTGPSMWKDNSAFRFRCKPSHLSYDDPIVFPGQKGKAHLHQFFGNTLADANSTYQSLRTTGNGTCDGGPLNRSAYWMPAMLDANNKVVLPDYMTIYYKRFPGTVHIPRGLKMVFGYDSRYPNKAGGNWICDGGSNTGSGPKIADVTNCPTNAHVVAQFGALSCWDGVNLDSPDHRSHMASCSYNGYGECQCPTTHPVNIPTFTMIAAYAHTGFAEYSNWRLSSDHQNINDPTSPRLPGGWTLHGDWFGAWDDDVMDMWINGCMNGFKSCSGGALGTGKQLKENPGFSWTTIPRLVDPPAKPIP